MEKEGDYQISESLADVLGDLFFGIYQINLDTEQIRAVHIDDDVKGLVDGKQEIHVDDFLKLMADVFYHAKSQRELLTTFCMDALRKYREDGITKVERELVRMYHGRYHRILCMVCLGKSVHADPNIILVLQNIDEQYKLRQDQFTMIQSLSNIYYTMYEVDLKREMITAIDNQMDSDIMLTNRGDFTQMMNIYGYNCIHYEDREKFLQFMSVHHLKNTLSFAQPVQELEYRRIYDYGMEWIRAEAILVSMEEDTAVKVLLATRNITMQKESGQTTKMQEELAGKQYLRKTDYFMKLAKALRIPMNTLFSCVALAQQEEGDTKKLRDMLKEIQYCSTQMMETLNALICYSQLETGAFMLNEDMVPVGELLDSFLLDWEEKIVQHKHRLVVQKDVIKHDIVLADRKYLKQIFDAVMDNAVRYTEEGGEILFQFREKEMMDPEKSCFEMTIQDNGCGMSQEFCKHLFDPFAKIPDYRVANEKGIGLGLALVKRLVEKMHGMVQVESELEIGTKVVIDFVFTLPAQEKEEKLCETSQAFAYAPNLLTSFVNKKVLVYETKQKDGSVKEILTHTNIDYDQVSSLDALCERFTNSQIGEYHLLIAEMGESNREMIRKISKLHRLQREDALDIPVLAIQTESLQQKDEILRQEEIKQLEMAGICEVIEKPLDMQSFLKALSWWIK